MKKRQITPVEVEIDGDYEAQMNYLEASDHGHMSDYAIEPVRPEPRLQPPKTWVPEIRAEQPRPRREINVSLSPGDQAGLNQAHQAVGQVINAPRREREHSGHTRQTDTAMGVAQASRYYSWQYIYLAAGAMFGLLALVWVVAGGNIGIYVASYIFGLAVIGMIALYGNRKQGLHHSSTGLGHHELDVEQADIESRERVALGTVDRHYAFLEKKMLVELELHRLEDKRNG